MPADRTNVSFEPRPLEMLYNKYGPPNKTATSSSSTTPFARPTPSPLKPSSVTAAAAAGKKVGRSAGDLPPRIPRRQELGDLKKLGRELTKMERVQMFFDMSTPVCNGKAKSRSQPTSAGLKDLKCWSTSCRRCSQEQKHEAGQRAKLKDLKSKLKLVAARTLPSSSDCSQSQTSTSPLRHSSKHVVSLPRLPLNYKRNASSSEDIFALRDARQSFKHMFYPQPSISRRAAEVRNYRFASMNLPPSGRGIFKDNREKMADSSESSSYLVPPAAAPVPSPVDDLYETKTATTFDADRVDSEQFGYVFERVSGGSSSGSWVSTSAHSDTATYSARAQRPSTAGTVPTPQRYVETRASMVPALSPTSPRQRTRDGESWPPQYTVVPSWPAVDDPFRFQYFGYGVHRDTVRRLHKSRGRRRNGKHGRWSDADQQPPPLPEPQKLKVVVPTYEERSTCNMTDYEHGHGRKPAPTSVAPSCALSFTAKSAKSRDSLSMSVCTVVSRQAQPASSYDAVPRLKDKARLSGKLVENVRGKGPSIHKDRSISSHRNSLD